MKMRKAIGALCAGIFSLSLVATANAVLVGRLPTTPGGTDFQAVYDTDLNITWLADANLVASNTFGVPIISGDMWDSTNTWISAMNNASYLGFSDWRLPTTLVPDSTCSNTDSTGINCIHSEMGHLFNVEGVSMSMPGMFKNIQGGIYWSGTEYFPGSVRAWAFDVLNAYQIHEDKTFPFFYAWAVRSGDVGISTVPVPATAWLFVSGIIGLLGVAKQNRHSGRCHVL